MAKRLCGMAAAGATVALAAKPAYAMHISEGILPAPWAALWFFLSLPFLYWGVRDLRIRSQDDPLLKPLLGLVGAAVFLISCMPVPVLSAGTCSHPVGTGLAAILIGPALTVVITSIALLLQALFLAHGGLTTLGADIFSMGVTGAFVGYGAFVAARHVGASLLVAAFLAGLLSNWATYAVTSFELASALHGEGDFASMFTAILLAFTPTQLPLGLFEGAIAAGALRFVHARRPELIRRIAPGGVQ